MFLEKLKIMAIKPIRLTSLKLIWMCGILSFTLYKEITALKTDKGIMLSHDGVVRLVDGTRFAAGRVEVLNRRQWGTVCDDSWTANNTRVICRQLGFSTGGELLSTFVPGRGRIWLDDVDCNGTEYSIFNCRYNGLGRSDCKHEEDVNVQCNDKYDIMLCESYQNCTFFINNTSKYKWQFSDGYARLLEYEVTNKGWFMYIDSMEGKPGDDSQLTHRTGVDIYGGNSIIFRYNLHGDPLMMFNVFIGAGEKGQLALSKSGDEGRGWQFSCLPINETIKDLVITFEAVRGSASNSIVAIGDIGITRKTCEPEGISCAFNMLQCGYEIIGSEISSLSWLFTFPYAHGPSSDHTNNSMKGGFMAIFNEYSEGDRTSLHSPIIHTNENDKMEFYYYLAGPNSGELQLTFVFADPQSSKSQKIVLWQEYGDHGTGWNYGCVKLPQNQNGKIVFTAIVGTSQKLNIAIDDISVSEGLCKKNTMMETCTFDDPRFCKYRISCVGEREYTWKKHNGTTPTFGTGPDMDVSEIKSGSYLYAESSYGNPGDSITVTFPVVEDTAVKYVRFWYHMYGETVGSLHLRYHSLESSTEEWTEVGDQGNKWRSFCSKLASDTNAFSLTAVRGSSYLGDIAIDNIRVDESICHDPLDCDFSVGICKYDLQIKPYDYNWIKVTDVAADSENGYFMEIKTKADQQEVVTSSLVSPEVNGKESEGSLSFLYQLYGANVNRLTIFSQNLHNNETEELWSTNDNTMTDWVVGCINIPPVQSMKIVFMSTNGFGPDGVTRLDNLIYHPQKCPSRNEKLNCTFDHPSLCDYKIKCDSYSPYKWVRAKSSPTDGTGAVNDHTGSFGKGYFMYVESSQGRLGDRVDIQFPPFISPPGHYLLFYYNMNGPDTGELQVNVDSGSSRRLRWSDAGDLKNNWQIGCIGLQAGEKTNVTFTAIRGNGPLGDMAIDDVSVVPGRCPYKSLACEFTDDFLCGYKNASNGPAWKRSYNDSGVYVLTKDTDEETMMRSPSENLTESCIRVHYQANSTQCHIDVYGNLKKILWLYSVNINDSMVGQFHIGRWGEFFLDFKSDPRDYCEMSINRVEVTPGTCPSLDCPDGMVACKDQSFCIDEKWVCDKEKECFDGSDESGCPITIGCEFSNAHSCGYNFGDSWIWWSDYSARFMPSDYGEDNYSLISPKQQVDDSCVRFSYRASNQFTLYALAHYGNDTNYTKWGLDFKNNELSWRVGQFFIPAGNVHLEFKASLGTNSFLQIDNITLLKGPCSSLSCSDDNFLCGSGEKCIRKKEQCNHFYECEDKSDESNCPSSLDCDFEDSYACGYEFSKNWTLTTGRHNSVPLNDHSKGYSYGHYMATTQFGHEGSIHLDPPEKEITSKTCLTFFYSFQGHSKFRIYDNNVLKLVIRASNVLTWQKSQLQLETGIHKLRFSVHLNSSDDKLALDSISTSIGSCPELVCEENWKRCQLDDICVPHYKFCDHEEDCPNGFDEQNCLSFNSVRLIGGENVNQGHVEYYHNGKWSRVCTRRRWSQDSVVCRELGYRFLDESSESKLSKTSSDIENVFCFGDESSLSNCRLSFCSNCFCFHSPWVDCSNTNCSSSKSPCPVDKRHDPRTSRKKDRCLSKELYCDGEQDCPGGTDEKNCQQCKPGEFQCLNKECISTSQRCDGVNDCQDSSDEHRCFIHNGTSFFSLQDGKYQTMCKSNLNTQEMANKLCKAVGKGNATISKPVSSGRGIKFTRKRSRMNTYLPGLSPKKVPSCHFLSVSCSGEECGTRGNIVNYQRLKHELSAFPGQWPWQAVFKGTSEEFCGGILIHPKYVLTNSDCVKDNQTKSVTLGTIELYGGGVKYNTTRKIIQPKVIPHTQSDLALLELTEPVEITDYIRPACLPSKPWQPDMECVSTGWGNAGGRHYVDNLKGVKVRLLSRDDCVSHYRDVGDKTQCAINNKYLLKCVTDLGGPLMCRNQHGHWEVVGVTSHWDLYCDRVFSPITYLDVYSSLDWILQQLN